MLQRQVFTAENVGTKFSREVLFLFVRLNLFYVSITLSSNGKGVPWNFRKDGLVRVATLLVRVATPLVRVATL